MPIADRSPFAGFYLPDYAERRTLVNLMATVIGARGGSSPHPELDGLPATDLIERRHIIYLVVDGLGIAQFEHYLDSVASSPFLGSQRPQVLSSVFPATTATATTTFLTGASPAEHAVLGWFLNLHDLGLVSAILPGTTRTGAALADVRFDLGGYLGIPSHLATVTTRRCAVNFGDLGSSRFSRACGRWDEEISIRTLDDLEAALRRLARREAPSLIYAYWPQFDPLCHQWGPRDPRCFDHLAAIDHTLARLAADLAGTETTLLVTADHGFVDTPVERIPDLAEVPELYGCLATLPTGDPRHANCFVRPHRIERFLERVASHLAEVCVPVPGEELLRAGLYGPGRPHPALESRVGDFVLLARDGQALASSVGGRAPLRMAGNHGGMGSEEMRIPLFRIEDAA